MLNQYKQEREPLSALALVCLCPAGPTPFSCCPFLNKTKHMSLLLAQTVSARQGPLPGQVAQCRHRTVTPHPGHVNPESFMEVPGSLLPLLSVGLKYLEKSLVLTGNKDLT